MTVKPIKIEAIFLETKRRKRRTRNRKEKKKKGKETKSLPLLKKGGENFFSLGFPEKFPDSLGSPEMSSPSASVRVEKATSDLLMGPDWTMNIDICDSINSDHWQAKDMVKAVKKRLQHKNPKVQFLALTLLETMMKNCSDFVHFQVVERDILQEMVKIVRKKTDMQVRHKILVLLDSWQEAFGGPGGKYPQYYWAYVELKQSGVEFPQRSADAALLFTPVTHPTLVPRHQPAGYGMPSNSSVRLDEAMASEMANLSLSDLDRVRSIMELLSDMLKAVNPNDREAVKDEVITDLVSQCRSNQKKLMQLLSSTGDEELLGQGLALNDSIQALLAKHEAIASGSPLPAETLPGPSTPIAPAPIASKHSEDEEDDDFAQLARRKSKQQSESSVHPTSSNHSDATTETSSTEASSSVASNALALPDPPAPVNTVAKDQDMIDLLSITLSTNPSPPVTPPSMNQSGSPASSVSPGGQYPFNPQPYTSNQGYRIPYHSYVAPWAQPQPQLSSSYPPPPWEAPAVVNPNPFTPNAFQFQPPYAAAAPTIRSPRPLQRYNSAGPMANYVSETQVNSSPKHLGPAPAPAAVKPFVLSNRLFDDLVELRNADGSLKTSNSPTAGSSDQGMIGGRK